MSKINFDDKLYNILNGNEKLLDVYKRQIIYLIFLCKYKIKYRRIKEE